MSRTALIIVPVFAALAAQTLDAGRTNPHVDRNVVRSGCPACHVGHGRSKSPMLDAPQQAMCLRCHGAVAPTARQDLSPDAKPALIGSLAGKAAMHPVDNNAFSSGDPNAVVCSSCHSPHRNVPELRPGKPDGVRLRAPNDPSLYENDLCLRCHGRLSRFDVAALTSATNRSYHPVSAPAPEKSMTVDPALSGKMINCTDCHGNSDPTGPRGPHASDVPGLLRKSYRQQDGGMESNTSFELCYSCHDRDAVLNRSTFPRHTLHIVDEKIACGTCHDPHGAITTRALIRVADGGRAGITPSLKTGRLAYVSDAPASGACYLNCHGTEHGPATYGAAGLHEQVRSTVPAAPPREIAFPPTSRDREPRPAGGVRNRNPERP